ncbi:ABC transporter substrate-binding protein [Nocardioides sp. Bht2]|uniref:ABC transporter substrate-binding protein n=1 Tax=Nocardioides sp. Bht2 TaxID=3392297 RepID=UPI0039B6E0F6
MFIRSALSVSAIALVLSGCTGSPESAKADDVAPGSGFPVEVTSCGHTSTLNQAPDRVVTLNQGATEVVLALGLSEQLAGTAYLDDAVPEKWRAAYDAVPVLAKEYPSHEAFLASEPDFAYASYASAFDAKVAGTPAELEKGGIGSYLSPFGCDDKSTRPAVSFDSVWAEVTQIATALGHPANATDLIAEQEKALSTLSDEAPGADLDVFWYDSGTKTPFVGANAGGPQLILDAIGAENIFADLDGAWSDGNWEDVIASDPDVIVLADAVWDTADDKSAYLTKDPVLKNLSAVKKKAFVTVPFSETTAGVRLVDGARNVAEQIAGLGLS